MKILSSLAAALLALPLWAAEFTQGIAISLGASAELVEAVHADERFPLMSVIKFPLALKVLHEVEQGRLSLDTRCTLTEKELDPQTWSPLRDAHPQGGTFTLKELLEYALAQSDNNACTYLFTLVGGAPAVQAHVQELMGEGVAITIACGEDAFRDRRMMSANHATPRAVAALLRACFIEKRLLSAEHTQLLWGIMAGPSAGAPRLAAGLPEGAELAHKTGSSGAHEGVTLAYNDAGVIRLPDGRTACVVSFIRDSREPAPAMDAAHAATARRAVELLERR